MKRDVLLKHIHKLLFLMRLTTVIILFTVFQLSAATTFGQKFTYKKNTTINQLFKEIKAQTGYNVIWYEGKLNSHMPVEVNFHNAPIEKVMDNVLAGRAVTYEIIGKAIVIKVAEPSFRDKVIGFFTSIDVRGRVLDENNEPLVGAVVKVKGTNQAVSTNSKGEFLLKNIDDKAVLVISFLGYETQEVKVSDKMEDIKLRPSEDKLQEVEINAGYYTVTDRERTGSISRITSGQIEKQPVNNVLQAIQANVPGVIVTQNTGVPGGGFNVQVRGRNSISQGNNPFYVIDGVPFSATKIASTRSANIIPEPSPLASISPLDIESIEILKDADATAIYGSRGANGVILITTKKGKTGNVATQLSISQGISKVEKKLDLMNISQYLEMRKEAFTNDKLTPATNQFDVNGTWESNRNIDWQKELIGGTAPNTNIHTTLSGGSENFKYLIGGDYYREGTVFPGNQSFKRTSGNSNLHFNSADKKFDAIFSTNYSIINSNLFTADLTRHVFLPPNFPSLLDENGLINWGNNSMYLNPIAFTKKLFTSKVSNLISNGVLNYNIISGLQLKTSLGYTSMQRKDYNNEPLSTISPASINYISDNRIAYFGINSVETWIIEPQLNFNKQLGKGNLNLLVGTTFQNSLTDGQTIKGASYTSDALLENIGSAGALSVFERQYLRYRYAALFGRINYNFNSKYIINATGRRDGSTRFGKDKRFNNFGAIGAAWIFSEENFIKQKLSFVSFAKIRSSFGITGNDQISDYGYLELWATNLGNSGTYQGTSTISPDQISNPEYAWEVNKKIELALELGLFKDKINLSLELYSNRSSNQLVRKQLAPSTGFISIQDNLPATVRNTGVELTILTNNISNRKLNWTTSFNVSIPRNKLISYPNLETSNDAINYEIGSPLTISKVYNSYLDTQTGLYAIEDHDKNGVIDINDRYLIEFIGRKYYGGLQNTFSYKGIQIDILFQFVNQRGKSYISGFNNPGRFVVSSPLSNMPIEMLDRWKKSGDEATFLKYSTLSTSYSNAVLFGNYSVEGASFIRLKNASIAYNLPKDFLKRVKLNGVKLYMQGQNLFTITKYKGLDPETQSLQNLPALRVLTAGLQINL